MFCVGVRKNELRYASAHTHIVESPRSAHQVGHQTQPDPRSPPTCQMTHVIEHERFIKTKNENRYLAVLVPSWGANRWVKALFGVPSRPDAHTAVFGGETVEH